MKGSFKAGFKYISNIFVKDREIEIEIGGPTDVKHVAHIGWDGQAGNAPTWMNEFKAGPEFMSPKTGNSAHGLSQWSSQDIEDSMTLQSGSDICNEITQSREVPCGVKKQKRKKLKSSTSSTSRSTRSMKTKMKLPEDDPKPMKIEVATY
ncbi:unnamed protein product [Cuscuta europaea]|uniref:CRIB domain-containing protein n=1 Tax=Cuscuta europaea TaxID=41803 RepID=A0A9P0Z172_CUSEU|nr:unnamed protein product [Cuscuta europaea]